MSLAEEKVTAKAIESLEPKSPAGVTGPRARGQVQAGEAGARRPGSVSAKKQGRTAPEAPSTEWAVPGCDGVMKPGKKQELDE